MLNAVETPETKPLDPKSLYCRFLVNYAHIFSLTELKQVMALPSLSHCWSVLMEKTFLLPSHLSLPHLISHLLSLIQPLHEDYGSQTTFFLIFFNIARDLSNTYFY